MKKFGFFILIFSLFSVDYAFTDERTNKKATTKKQTARKSPTRLFMQLPQKNRVKKVDFVPVYRYIYIPRKGWKQVPHHTKRGRFPRQATWYGHWVFVPQMNSWAFFTYRIVRVPKTIHTIKLRAARPRKK